MADWRSNSQRLEGGRREEKGKKANNTEVGSEMNLPNEHLRLERHTGQSPHLDCIIRVFEQSSTAQEIQIRTVPHITP